MQTIYRIARKHDFWRGLYSTGAFMRLANSLDLWKSPSSLHPMPYEDYLLKDKNIQVDHYFGFGDVEQLLAWVYLTHDVFQVLHRDELCLYKFKSVEAHVGITQAIFKRDSEREIAKISLLDFEKSLDKNLLKSYLDQVTSLTKEPERV